MKDVIHYHLAIMWYVSEDEVSVINSRSYLWKSGGEVQKSRFDLLLFQPSASVRVKLRSSYLNVGITCYIFV